MKKSRNLRGKCLIQYKKSLKLTTLQREILVGTLLGDACISCGQRPHPTYNIKFEQAYSKFEYINHLYNIFEPFVGTSPQIRTLADGRQSFWFRTYRHKAFEFYYNQFYPLTTKISTRKKRVPRNIDQLLTPRGLAYWFMDDGTFKQQSQIKKSYLFSTHSFPLNDQKKLQKILREKFKIYANIHKDKNFYRIYILARSNDTFLQQIREYIHPIFKYKL